MMPVIEASRRQYYLESFELCSFKRIFISKDFSSISVTTPGQHNKIVDAVIGTYIGKNAGVIQEIRKGEIVVEEVIKSSKGNWMKSKTLITVNKSGHITSCSKMDSVNAAL